MFLGMPASQDLTFMTSWFYFKVDRDLYKYETSLYSMNFST